jgi:aminopeptidase N
MIRMMMWSPQEGDARFIAMMRDFVATYRLKAATTEDFKAMVDKHMTPQMDLDGNHRMDWFFNEYVYGTDLPEYHFESQVIDQGGTSSLHAKLVQSGVPPGFKMLVPIYFEFADGKIAHAGTINIGGAKTVVEQTLPLPRLASPIKRVMINYLYDVLSVEP